MFAEKEEKGIPLDKQNGILYKSVVERTGDIEKLHNSVNFQNLIYQCKGSAKDFNDFINAETLFDDINFEKIRLEDVEKNQMDFESKLSSVILGGNKSDKRKH